MSFGQVKKEIKDKISHTYSLCKLSDMPEDDMKQETIDLCVTATEKYQNNYEHAAKMIKQNLDKKFGGPFQVVVGESYGFYVVHQENTLLYMFTGGNIAILIWRTV
ncbi:dynein axonemal light chain 4-like [Microplitis demolitor]|uniref:dynein axonemal light chain 4-like n=1 Tax=Microplitis demolitor TaxID=69319 RepID=UPI00235B701C|nr:dynein axonemal light chain 4-like [Microplitis demolitor]